MNAQLQPPFDWARPAYGLVFRQRIEQLQRLRANPAALPALKLFYRDRIAQFIGDWGITADPRNALLTPTRPVIMPFILFPKQVEWVEWLLERARLRESGLTEKSRDCGLSWLAVAVAVSLCLLRPNITIGFGSSKEDKLDRSGDPDALFTKGRTFLAHLPRDFRGGWNIDQHSAHLRLIFPETQSAIIGEAGDNIGRGGRSSIFFIDESAHLARPELIDSSLASNTDCRIDISSVAGMANSFARKRHSGKVSTFTFRWTDDPRKDAIWYARQAEILGPEILASEVDINYLGSTERQLIPSSWIIAAVDAHRRLGIEISGQRYAALDVGDQGADVNAFCGRHGILLRDLSTWSGAGSDLFATTGRAMTLCEQLGYSSLYYDSTGVGSAVRGDSDQINRLRAAEGKPTIRTIPFIAGAAPLEGSLVSGRKNQDFFANLKAMSWWNLRVKFQKTAAALAGRPWVADELISIDGSLPELSQLQSELSQIQFNLTATGKVAIDKLGDGCASPNRADGVMICFNPLLNWMETWIKLSRTP